MREQVGRGDYRGKGTGREGRRDTLDGCTDARMHGESVCEAMVAHNASSVLWRVLGQDLWRRMDAALDACRQGFASVEFRCVKGHCGNHGNERQCWLGGLMI